MLECNILYRGSTKVGSWVGTSAVGEEPTQPFNVGPEADPGERQGEARHKMACEAEA